jgi:hypothetical protein
MHHRRDHKLENSPSRLGKSEACDSAAFFGNDKHYLNVHTSKMVHVRVRKVVVARESFEVQAGKSELATIVPGRAALLNGCATAP